MDPGIGRVTRSAAVPFADGLGQRRVVSGVEGEALEALAFREELTASPSFELALRDRVTRLADFRSEHYTHVRGVEKITRGITRVVLVSDHVPGVRLAEILSVAESRLLPLETHAALCLIRQLVHAVAVLHDKAPDLCHGAIGPERLVVTPHARLMVVEHVLGSALEGLRYTNKQYWEQLRVPLPRTFGMPLFDRRTDVTQVGATALALIIGRPLADDEFPTQVGEMAGSALALSAEGGLEPLPQPIRVWLQRALQVDSRTPFSSALEAWAELDRALHYSDPVAELKALKVFMARFYAAIGIDSAVSTSSAVVASVQTPVPTPAIPGMATSQAKATATSSTSTTPLTSPSRTTVPAAIARPSGTTTPSAGPAPTTASPAAVPSASRIPMPTHQPLPTPKPWTAPVPATPQPATQLDLQGRVPAPATPTTEFWERLGSPDTENPAEPPTYPGSEQTRQSVPAYRHSRLRLSVAALLLMALTSGVTLVARRYLMPPVVAGGMGTLVVQTNPTGAEVDIDGQRRGITPLSLELPPGRHILKLAAEGNVRSLPVTITAGGQFSQFIELPRAASAQGELLVRTEPAGAQVTVDGQVYGRSPVTVGGLAPGTHKVVLQNDLGSITQEVKIDAGTTASLVVPMTPPANVPVSGWISVKAPAELQIYENDRLLGTSQSDRIMVSAGRHRFLIVNEPLGYNETQTVTVAPGRVSTLRPTWPKGSMSINAIPWAEVWLDGQQIGETPLGNVAVPIGPHEVVLRHPDLGEKRVRSVVTLGAPSKVSVDLRQR